MPELAADERGSTRMENNFTQGRKARKGLRGVVLSALFVGGSVGIMFAQVAEDQKNDVPVVTVCEALQDRSLYNGKVIVVVGRLDRNDEGSWLGEDCYRKIVTDGYVWANVISTSYSRSEMKPPLWNAELLASKLKMVQSTTKLHKEENYSGGWSAIFGRLETRSSLQVVTGGSRGELMGYGFGHLNLAPAQMVTSETGYHELKTK